MKTFYKFCLAAFLAAPFFGCSNNLDEKAYSKVTEAGYRYTTDDFEPFVASTYRTFRSFISTQFYHMAQENCSDIIVMPANASGWDDGGLYKRMHNHTWNSEQSHVINMWNTFYQGALTCNKVLEDIQSDKIPAPSPTEKSNALAEIRAVRAFYYWLICDNFGDAPLVTVPTDEYPAKNTRQEIYDFIVAELQEVIPQLSEEQSGKMYGRMNKWAAKDLLANIYLNAEIYVGEPRWNECIRLCDDIIESGKFRLADHYNASFRASGTESCNEILFAIPFDQKLGGENNIWQISWHGELKRKFETEAMPFGCGSSMGITQFIDTYHPNDTRLQDTWLMGPQFAADGTPILCTYDRKGEQLNYTKEIPDGNYTSETEGYRMFKFEVEKGANNNSTTDFAFFRYAEVLLMKAECLARTRQPGAGALVTEIRKRNFKAHPADAIVTDVQLTENSIYPYGYVENYKIVDPGNTEPILYGRLLDELGWEFAWEAHRRRDLIRFGVFTTKSWLSHRPNGDYRTVFPLPESVLTSNPNLKQNPDYLQ